MWRKRYRQINDFERMLTESGTKILKFFLHRLPVRVRRSARETLTAEAQWYVVPADRKWYRNYVIGSVVIETMKKFGMKYPEVDASGVVIEQPRNPGDTFRFQVLDCVRFRHD